MEWTSAASATGEEDRGDACSLIPSPLSPAKTVVPRPPCSVQYCGGVATRDSFPHFPPAHHCGLCDRVGRGGGYSTGLLPAPPPQLDRRR